MISMIFNIFFGFRCNPAFFTLRTIKVFSNIICSTTLSNTIIFITKTTNSSRCSCFSSTRRAFDNFMFHIFLCTVRWVEKGNSRTHHNQCADTMSFAIVSTYLRVIDCVVQRNLSHSAIPSLLFLTSRTYAPKWCISSKTLKKRLQDDSTKTKI